MKKSILIVSFVLVNFFYTKPVFSQNCIQILHPPCPADHPAACINAKGFCCENPIQCIKIKPTAFPTYTVPSQCFQSLGFCTSNKIMCPGTAICCPSLVDCQGLPQYLDVSCDICGCEEDKISKTFDCPKCDEDCKKCTLEKTKGGIHDKGGAWTALGCIPTGDFYGFTAWFLKIIFGIAGGVAFLLVIFGGFRIITSAGDPKGVQAAKETITSALIGLLFIIFSVFLLELIGVKILGIPGFLK